MYSRRRIGLACAALAGLLAFSLGAPASTASKHTAAFDLDHGNAATEYAIPIVQPVIEELSPGGNDLTIILHWTSQITAAWFDAVAPYHPTAVGIASRLPRQERTEATNRNVNIALLYASYQIFSSLDPQESERWRKMLTDVGLDPDDQTTNPNTPVGIGNSAGRALAESRRHDGMNQHGDEGGRKYHRTPFADYTNYQPVNTADELTDPTRWQPAVVTDDNGIYRQQRFVTPQMRLADPYTYSSPEKFRAPAPIARKDGADSAEYRAQADNVLHHSAKLTERQKLVAETFDHKFVSIGNASLFLSEKLDLSIIESVQQEALFTLSNYDTTIAVWQEKHRYDAVRPFSAIAHLYGDKPVQAWGGPGKGTVADMPANQWRSYINSADHPEYPSGSAAVCASQAQMARNMYQDDQLGFPVEYAKGSSRIEPGSTPSSDTTLRFDTWSELEEQCGQSRVWGGVHFQQAVDAGADLGHQIADVAYRTMRGYVAGTAPPLTAGK
ncbi:hypothetical protein EV191_101843 [Tamaricihabitans halophyticus]|uniref:PAP2 superfamily protein n=1 Tax=Tamaricihabitans halophyticus TaxID=1262583 RepID=A0A4R2R4P5_9PSEU|nr:vanadium-dependent haloperoxidase [Tamaricihabitans halophyticus]TCP56894.1 hypothetical protein EV191_101843 [Tamaricihabitans halophyticus]